MPRAVAATLVALALASPGLAGDDSKKAKKPGLELRATPRVTFSPARVVFTAELKGGEDVEEYYCPEVEWDWDDGGKSVNESDCPPFAQGTEIDRRFTAEHEYRYSGNYTVKVSLRHAGRTIVAQKVRVTVRPGLGEGTIRPDS